MGSDLDFLGRTDRTTGAATAPEKIEI